MTAELTSWRIRPSRCPSCRSRNTGASTASPGQPPERPKPGDAAVCAYCSVPLVYDERLELRWPTMAEIAELRANYDAVLAIAAVTFTRAELQQRV